MVYGMLVSYQRVSCSVCVRQSSDYQLLVDQGVVRLSLSWKSGEGNKRAILFMFYERPGKVPMGLLIEQDLGGSEDLGDRNLVVAALKFA